MPKIKRRVGSNKTKIVRHASRLFFKESEEKAVAAVLKAMKEPTLKGDLRALVKKMR